MAWEQRDTDQLIHDIHKLREECRKAEWQPIETAPNASGTRALVYCGSRPLVFGKDGSVVQYTDSGIWLAELIEWHGNYLWCVDGVVNDGYNKLIEPSHWMPLPAAPMNQVHPTKEEV